MAQTDQFSWIVLKTMDTLEFTAWFEVNRTFGSGAILIFRQKRMIAPPLTPVLIKIKASNGNNYDLMPP